MPFPVREVKKEKTSSSSSNRGSAPPKRKQAPKPAPRPQTPPQDEDQTSDIEEEINEELNVSEDDDEARPIAVTAKKQTARKPAKKEVESRPAKVPASMMMLAAVKHLNASEIVYGGKSYYIPSSWSFFKILEIMHENCSENSSLHKFCAQYHAGLSRVYYGIIWIIQVLRARQAAGALEQSEFQFLKYFENNFNFEELPVAGPLVLALGNVASFKPEGDVYDFVVPKLPNLSVNTASAIYRNDRNHLFIPPVPFMIDFMYKFGAMTAAQMATALTNDQFEPFDKTTGASLAGVPFGADFVSLSTIQEHSLTLPGISPAWYHSTSTMIAKRMPIKRMRLPNVAAYPKNTVKSFCGFDVEHDWFSKVIAVAGAEAKYFAGSTVLSNVLPTTGRSSVLNGVHNTRPHNIPALTDWYPDFPFNMKATYSSTEVMSPDDFHIGALSSTMMVIPNAATNGSFAGIGTRAAQDKTGDYFENNLLRFSSDAPLNTWNQLEATIKFNYYRPKGGERNFDE
nr:capsid protein [Sarcosphaera coronaria partitivirus]